MDIGTSEVRLLMAARYMFMTAVEQSRLGTEPASMMAINLLQDAIELFARAIALKLHLDDLKDNTPFPTILTEIDKALSVGKGGALRQLPFPQTLKAVNGMRVRSKHHGEPPSLTALREHITVARAIFEQVTFDLWDANFHALNRASQLPPGRTRSCLEAAEQAYRGREFLTTLIECRKAIFLEFESMADIRGGATGGGDEGAALTADFDADDRGRHDDWMNNYVKTADDWIFFDRSKLEITLIKEGGAPWDYYDVAAHTPAVYQFKADEWLHRHDFSVMEQDDIDAVAAEMLEKTFGLIERRLKARRAIWRSPPFKTHEMRPKREGVMLYNLATLDAPSAPLPSDWKTVSVRGWAWGKDGKAQWWVVHHSFPRNRNPWGGFRDGYVPIDDLEEMPESDPEEP